MQLEFSIDQPSLLLMLSLQFLLIYACKSFFSVCSQISSKYNQIFGETSGKLI